MIFIKANFEIIGKPEVRTWKNKEGTEFKTYRLNVAQNDGVDVATIKCPESVYGQVRRGDVGIFLCSYAEYDNGADFKIVELEKLENYGAGIAGNQPASNPNGMAGTAGKK